MCLTKLGIQHKWKLINSETNMTCPHWYHVTCPQATSTRVKYTIWTTLRQLREAQSINGLKVQKSPLKSNVHIWTICDLLAIKKIKFFKEINLDLNLGDSMTDTYDIAKCKLLKIVMKKLKIPFYSINHHCLNINKISFKRKSLLLGYTIHIFFVSLKYLKFI